MASMLLASFPGASSITTGGSCWRSKKCAKNYYTSSYLTPTSWHKTGKIQKEYCVLMSSRHNLKHHYKGNDGGSTGQECDRKYVVNATSAQSFEYEPQAQYQKSILDSVKDALDAFYRFSRPYSVIATVLATTSGSLLAVEKLSDLSPVFFIAWLQAVVAAFCMNIFNSGVNQLYDVEIDKINKPYLPLASGEYSFRTGVIIVVSSLILSFWLAWIVGSWPLFWALFINSLLGAAYSMDLPFLRWKKNPILAATNLLATQASIPLGYFLHMQTYVFKRPVIFPRQVIFCTAIVSLFFIVVAFSKDIPDIEGDKKFGVQSLSVRLGQKRVFWICVSLLEMAYGVTILVGATSPFLWSKISTGLGHAILASILWYHAKSVDLKSTTALQSFYVFIWKTEMTSKNIEDVNFEDDTEDINDVELQVKRMINFALPPELQVLSHVRKELDKRQRICAVVLLCYIVHALHLLQLLSSFRPNEISDGNTERESRRFQLMRQLLETERCRDVIRMGPGAFMHLCEKLRATGIVKDSIRSTVEEQVAKFLHILGHNVKNRTVSFFFLRSGETISRHFHNVLRAVISLEEEFLVQPSGRDVPPQILSNSRFYPYFKDCIGAIDGTHIRVKVSRAEAPRFRGRKDYLTQNVFAACNFDMKFTYVLRGWEGTASDSRILKNALRKEDPLRIPEGLNMNRGKKVATNSQDHPSKDNLRWSDDMDHALLNAFMEQFTKGNKQDGSWTSEAYANVVQILRIEIGPQITKQHLKNRMKTLKDHFAEAYDLFNSLSGFSWSPITKKFEAEEEVWEDLIKDKPYAIKWKRMQIKHYDMLKEMFGTDRATGKNATTAKERLKQWKRQQIDLNDSFEVVGRADTDINMGNDTPHSAANSDQFSPTYGQSNQIGGTSSSRGTKRKAHMVDLVEAQYESVALGINSLVEVMKEGNFVADKLHEVAERQVAVAERQVEIAEKGLTIMQQSRPRYYSESDVWDLLADLGVLDPYRMQCYRFLCGNEQKKRELFGVPPQMRLEALFQIMNEAGIRFVPSTFNVSP